MTSFLVQFVDGFNPNNPLEGTGIDNTSVTSDKIVLTFNGAVQTLGVNYTFSYDSTKRHFVPRQFGYEGAVPPTLEELTPDHPQIAFRKQHLGRYLANLVTKPYDGKMLDYLDMVGKMHTPKAGSRDIDVPLVQMNALMGFVSDALLNTILGLDLDDATKTAAVRSFNKLLWLQNDLIARHYAA